MRVIAGSARRLILKTVEGMDTRPTTDRIKETLFNMINNRLYGCEFLDLFAGSGAIGIEALSRGAREAVFIENGAKQAACIRANLETTRLADRARVLNCDVIGGLKRLERENRSFDVIFMDPPYNREHERRVLEYLKDSRLAGEETLLITEASLETDFSWAGDLGYRIERYKRYKTNQHVFLRRENMTGVTDEKGNLSGQL